MGARPPTVRAGCAVRPDIDESLAVRLLAEENSIQRDDLLEVLNLRFDGKCALVTGGASAAASAFFQA
jgi:hypothetical protein